MGTDEKIKTNYDINTIPQNKSNIVPMESVNVGFIRRKIFWGIFDWEYETTPVYIYNNGTDVFVMKSNTAQADTSALPVIQARS